MRTEDVEKFLENTREALGRILATRNDIQEILRRVQAKKNTSPSPDEQPTPSDSSPNSP